MSQLHKSPIPFNDRFYPFIFHHLFHPNLRTPTWLLSINVRIQCVDLFIYRDIHWARLKYSAHHDHPSFKADCFYYDIWIIIAWLLWLLRERDCCASVGDEVVVMGRGGVWWLRSPMQLWPKKAQENIQSSSKLRKYFIIWQHIL